MNQQAEAERLKARIESAADAVISLTTQLYECFSWNKPQSIQYSNLYGGLTCWIAGHQYLVFLRDTTHRFGAMEIVATVVQMTDFSVWIEGVLNGLTRDGSGRLG